MLVALLVGVSVFLVIVGFGSLVALFKGCLTLRRLRRNDPAHDRTILLKSPLTPAISVIAVPRDDSPESIEFVRRLSTLQYSRHEVVVVLDGQTDKQVRTWTLEFGMSRSARGGGEVRSVYESQEPLRIVLVDLETGAVATALDVGIDTAACPVIAIVHQDTDFDIGLLLNLIGPMLEDPEGTIAVCGLSAPPARAGGLVSLFSDLESLRTWMGRSAATSGWGKLLPAAGSTMLVRREAFYKAGGGRGGIVASWLRLHAIANTRIAFAPAQTSRYAQARTLKDLSKRVLRDQAELAAAIRGDGMSGVMSIGWGVPALLLTQWVRPLLETLAYLLLIVVLVSGHADGKLAELVVLSTIGMGMLISMAAVVFREFVEFRGTAPGRLAGLFFAAIPENLGYRQLRNWWLIVGIFAGKNG